jgi:hypothetical protein
MPTNHRRRRSATILLALCFPPLLAMGQMRFEEDFDDPNKRWEEVAIQLPDAPKPENLLPFEVSIASQQFSVDAASLTVGSDGVVRYTVVSTSSAGARNVSYEGIRCSSLERKLYAFGQPDGSWSRSRRDRWESVRGSSPNRYQATLAYEYFCEGRTVAGRADQMLTRLRYKRPMSPHTAQ